MVTVKADDCVGCGACADVCPENAIKVDDVAIINQDVCISCGLCIDECPAGAIVE
jgi:NAD-dependent dihydropyrimidine dehydrogenase PreA subunit